MVKGELLENGLMFKNIIIHKASEVRKVLVKMRDGKVDGDKILWLRLSQIYSCRIFGLCIYRNEATYKQESKKILQEK